MSPPYLCAQEISAVGRVMLVPFAEGDALANATLRFLSGTAFRVETRRVDSPDLMRVFLAHHVTWSVNSACHLGGSQTYGSDDNSRDIFVFGVLAMGEGWHNTHHAFRRRRGTACRGGRST